MNHYSRSGVDKIVLDSVAVRKNKLLKGGTGQAFDWSEVKKIHEYSHPFLFLAGGINPKNVTDALLQAAPDGVDLSRGVEESPGNKDRQLVEELMKNINKSG